MAPCVPHPQAFFFYDSDWNANLENEFLLNLSQYALAANTILDCIDVTPICHSIFFVNEKCETFFFHKEAMRCFKQLKHRHEVFGFLVGLLLVHYDSDSNIVAAPSFVWDYIIMKFLIAEAYMTNGEAEWPEMCFIFGTPKPVDVFDDHEVIEIFDDRSIPRSPEAHNRVPSIPTNVRRESPSPISSAFWNDLPKIIGRSEVASQDSVQYPPPRTTTFTLDELIVGACQDQTRILAQRSRIRQSHTLDTSTGKAGCSSHASSATPKKSDRHCH
ncbi:hypothetical protein CDL12_11061 [Handroanthus impetiginosus]|uniref:Uncharacterized protein n=1 Tax=Handroanthus impetiginosus TaxID=429701 RepID=A0A2G9HFI9_9LAMI|nr:hypothetical protein CDL12_11061 [Handroanthus impetiginosus]